MVRRMGFSHEDYGKKLVNLSLIQINSTRTSKKLGKGVAEDCDEAFHLGVWHGISGMESLYGELLE